MANPSAQLKDCMLNRETKWRLIVKKDESDVWTSHAVSLQVEE